MGLQSAAGWRGEARLKLENPCVTRAHIEHPSRPLAATTLTHSDSLNWFVACAMVALVLSLPSRAEENNNPDSNTPTLSTGVEFIFPRRLTYLWKLKVNIRSAQSNLHFSMYDAGKQFWLLTNFFLLGVLRGFLISMSSHENNGNFYGRWAPNFLRYFVEGR